MTQTTPIEAVRNRKTQKLFIVVDDTLDTRYKVINPSGEVLILPDLLFEEDPITVTPDQFGVEFTPEQLDAFHKQAERKAAQAAQEAARAREQPRVVPVTTVAPERRRTPSTRREPKLPSRRGLGATWSAPRLTFYRHKIDPLDPKQSFKIVVEGVGSFEITKEDFLAHFNDVVMSPTYRSDGLYSYRDIPDKARRYLKA